MVEQKSVPGIQSLKSIRPGKAWGIVIIPASSACIVGHRKDVMASMDLTGTRWQMLALLMGNS